MTIYHVNQTADDALRTIREEVFDRENRAVVAVTGPQGVGKTQRLLVTAAEARERHAFVVYFDVTSQSPWVLRGLAEAFQKAAKDAGLVKMLGSPSWLRTLGAHAKSKTGEYDPKEAGRQIAEALNATAPSLLLLNDLHNLVELKEVEVFVKTLEEVTSSIKSGVLVMFSCYASYLAWLTANQPAFASRINRAIPLAGLSDDEARLVLAKKLLSKRIVEDLEPTYPFDREAVLELNRAARGNPRRLFEIADFVLERAVVMRAYQIDRDLVNSALVYREDVGVAERDAAPDSLSSESVPPLGSHAASVRTAERPSLWGKRK
ncbi:MAG: AAA family ATPase [Thermoplasmata archaeon]